MTKTDAKWLERVRQWQESGQTAEAFAVGRKCSPEPVVTSQQTR